MKTKFRKIVILLTAALLVSVLGACSNSSSGILKDSDYGDEFTNSEGFKDIKEDVTDFYNMTMKAYNESDKKHLCPIQLRFFEGVFSEARFAHLRG